MTNVNRNSSFGRADGPFEPNSSRVTPDDILRQIEQMKDSFNLKPPGLLERIFSVEARERAYEIQAAKTAALVARRRLLEALSDSVQASVNDQLEDIKARIAPFVPTTVADAYNELGRMRTSMIASLRNDYSAAADKIGRCTLLTMEQKEEMLNTTYDLTQKAEAQTVQTFDSILDYVGKELTRMARKIEDK